MRQAVEVASGVIERYRMAAASGKMDEAEAKRAALAELKGLRYSGAEYFWVNDMAPRMMMHPTKPELDGQDLGAMADPNGLRLFVAMVEVVRKDGAGFVALAQRSAAAAREVKALIDDSVSKVDAGSLLVNDAGATMQEVVASVRRVNSIIGDITAASVAQEAGIGQVNRAIAEMDGVTQKNAALVEEAAAAAESMRQQADRLSEVVGVFKVVAEDGARRLPALA